MQIEEEEKENVMDTYSSAIGELDFDILSEAEVFFKNYKVREPKNVMDLCSLKKMPS